MSTLKEPKRRTSRALIGAIALTAVLAACGSGDEGSATEISASPESAATSDTSATNAASGDGTSGTVDAGSATTVTPGLPQTAPTTGGGTSSAATGGGGSASSVADAASGLTGAELEAFLADRYRAYWDAFDAARANPSADPMSAVPQLAELAAGEQLDVTYQSIIDLAEAGEAIREPDAPAVGGTTAADEHRVRIDRIDGTLAELTGCVVNDDVRYITSSGVVVREGASTVQATATMAVSEGQWKVIRSAAVDIADGVTGCWNAPENEFPY